MGKINLEVIKANYIQKLIKGNNLSRDTYRNIEIVPASNRYKNFRDTFYNAVGILNSEASNGHAICLAGLRRTGKSILLEQLHYNSNLFGIAQEEVLHIILSTSLDGKSIDRDNFGVSRIDSKNIEYPSITEIKQFIKQEVSKRKIKCVMIDEVTLCSDLILTGKSLVDWLLSSGIKVVLAGTESASFNLAANNSLYSRLIILDISYIPFGEYCRVKGLDTSTTDKAVDALNKFMYHGNILDDNTKLDTDYIEGALGVNVALSIVNSDNELFEGYTDRIKSLVESIIKYYKLIGESITVEQIAQEISRSDITRALNNLNSRRKKRGEDTVDIAVRDRKMMAISGAEEYFKRYNLSFDISQIKLSNEQLSYIDNIFSSMGLLYGLKEIPGSNIQDINMIHSLGVNIANSMSTEISKLNLGVSSDDLNTIRKEIISTALGGILENIVALHYIKKAEKKEGVIEDFKEYRREFKTARKLPAFGVYKYRNSIIVDGRAYQAEIDLIIVTDTSLKLIEIKKSSIVDENQTRWLNNEAVVDEIRELVSPYKPVEKEVYYLGEERFVGDVHYINIANKLIEEYNNGRVYLEDVLLRI